MYLSHYSTPGIVLYYLIRQVPAYLLTVQNDGYGGPPDRIFHDLSLSWYNGCMKVLADNKELIPEFYLSDGLFLTNVNRVELGLNHLEEKVNDVSLPPWASSVQDFILKNREALECNLTSAHLHHWIDLVFGSLQRSENASVHNNLYQPQTYSVDWSTVNSKLERQGLEAQVRNFGQCPSQHNLPATFLTTPHPQRLYRSFSLLTENDLVSAELMNLRRDCESQQSAFQSQLEQVREEGRLAGA